MGIYRTHLNMCKVTYFSSIHKGKCEEIVVIVKKMMDICAKRLP